MTGSAVAVKSVSAEKIYNMFLCPCCGDTIATRCCPMAEEMIDYINSQISAGLSEEEVIIQTVKKYGITSIIESKRDEIEAKLKKSNPNLFPSGKLSFNEAIGKQAPDFSLESIDGNTIKLSDYRGKNVILFFNEGSMCYPACWNQISELGSDKRFNNDNVVAFSIVIDQKSDWEKIIKNAPGYDEAKILFDPTRAVSSAYDVLSLKSSMHKGSYPGHTYFIIDKEGIIRYTLDDPNMAIWNDKLNNELEKISGA
jgi:peroxiredoxin Q/BCP